MKGDKGKLQCGKTKKRIIEIKKKEQSKCELVKTDSEEGKKRKGDGRWEKNIG